MLVQIRNNVCQLVNPSAQDAEWMYSFLSFKDSNYETMQRLGKKTYGDGQVHLFSPRTYQYATGLHYLVRQQCAKLGKVLDEVDLRDPVPELTNEVRAELRLPPWTLRDYQEAALDRIVSPPRAHYMPGRGILHHPTGAGKSHVASAIAYAFPGEWAFLVHRSHLGGDVAQRWESLTGTPAGRVMSGQAEIGEKFTCCTFQTLKRRIKSDPGVKDWVQNKVTGLLVDECHITGARDIVKVLQQFKSANLRIGLSGTPMDRSDKRSLVTVAMLGPVIHRIRAEELIEAGVLARPTIRLLPCHQTSPAETWQKAYDELVVNSTARNELIAKTMKVAERPGMVFVKHVKHGLILTKMAERQGLAVEFVDGTKNTLQRDRAIKGLREARLDYVVCTSVFDEGVDIRGLRSVFLAGGGKAPIKVLQQIGRALRREEGKEEATIFDVDDRGNKWLRKHARNRVKVCLREGYEVVQD